MTDLQAIEARHSVRSYLDKPIEPAIAGLLENKIRQINRTQDLNFQLVLNEPRAFSSLLARYGRFSGVKNYIVCAGPKSADLEEKVGYYGEQLVLLAQKLGLNTCWVGLTFKKVPEAFHLRLQDKFVCVIALGYGTEPGRPHRSKDAAQVADITDAPQWFLDGVNAALLAPTAVNQQKFWLQPDGDKVVLSRSRGPMSRIDEGIVRLHFEIGSQKGSSIWK